MTELLIHNATILDMETGKERQVDVAIENGQITAITSSQIVPTTAQHVVEAEGQYLFPGFIDFHTHLFTHGSTFGMDADRLFSAGVTCTADMGSAGWVNYPALHLCDLENKQMRLFSYLNISPIGQPGKGINEPLNDEVLNLEQMRELMQEYPGEIVGLKVRVSRGIVGDLGLQPLKRAVELGEALGLPVCVHTTDPPFRAGLVAQMLRPGDVYSHMFHGKGNTILDKEGHVQRELFAAQERGVQMEVGNGRINFSFPVAEQAFAQGFLPDIISSDSTPATFHKEIAMWDLPKVMSKFLMLGMTLPQVVRAVTEVPAKQLRQEKQIGFIREGYQADLVLCQLKNGEVWFQDSDGNRRQGVQEILPLMTIAKGTVVYQAS